MKSKFALLGLASLVITFAASAQGIENDDMYFNSKDRAKVRAAKASEVSYTASIKKNKRETVADEPVNPTDSYSARNVNPEYEARSNSQTAQADNQDYFVNNYQYSNASNFNNWNNNFSNWYNSPWYGGNYYDPYINSWNSPYYGNAYGNPWCNPYYSSGWSSSFSYSWGSSWGNYGWGMTNGYGNPYYNSWAWNYGYAPWSSYSYYGMGYPNYGYGYGYPTQVVIIDNASYRGPVYGKRASRSSQLSPNATRTTTRSTTRDAVTTNNGDRPAIIGGRTATTTSRTQSDYYNRSWRYQSQQSTGNGSPSYGDSNSGSSNTRSSWESNQRSSWNGGSNSGSSSRSYDTGRSSSGGGSSSGSSYSGGGSSSGSRSSGRGH